MIFVKSTSLADALDHAPPSNIILLTCKSREGPWVGTLSLTSIKYLLAHVHVKSTERVVHDHNVATRIHSTSDGDSLPLPAREVDPTLANHRLIAVGEKV